MTAVWEAAVRKATYWQLDETPLLVGCGNRKENDWSYKKKYVWTIRATLGKLVWFIYESGIRGKKAIEPFLKDFIGFYTTDGYEVYKIFDDPGGGALMKKALKYALAEWPAMKRVLENGDVEISNNLAEQMMRHIKMNLKTASNIGSEESAQDNAFMFSLIESCKLNGLAPEKYITFLLRKLKGANQYTDKNALLPCICTA